MVKVIRTGRALGFAGAGVTFPLGYPNWPQLIERLATEVRAVRGEQIESNGQSISVQQVLHGLKAQPLVQAQILKENLGGAYFSLMASLFGPRDTRSALISNLVGLPFKHFLTSNYDPGIELHHSSSDYESICLHHNTAAQFIIHHADDDYRRRIVHVHGKYDEPAEIILTEEDYGVYVRSAVVEEFWHHLPLFVRFVFFGFSFEDIDLLYGFRHARMALGGNGLELQPRHFAVMDLADASRELAIALSLRMRYGIDPVFYPNPKNDFAEYDNFIAELKRDVAGPHVEPLVEPPIVEALERVEAVVEPVEAQAIVQQPPPEVILEGVERLKQVSIENMGRRQTGDLQ